MTVQGLLGALGAAGLDCGELHATGQASAELDARLRKDGTQQSGRLRDPGEQLVKALAEAPPPAEQGG